MCGEDRGNAKSGSGDCEVQNRSNPGRAKRSASIADPSGLDLKAWIGALSAVPAGPMTEDQILRWVEGPLRRFFPFQRFLGGYGRLSGGRIQMRNLVTSGHQPAFIASLEDAFNLKARGCFAWWVQNRAAFILDPACPPPFATSRELEEIRQFSLGVIAAHGVVDPFANAGTYISFSGVAADHPERTRASLNLIAPVLHALFLATEQVAGSAARPDQAYRSAAAIGRSGADGTAGQDDRLAPWHLRAYRRKSFPRHL